MTSTAQLVEIGDTPEDWAAFYADRGWTDGLPVVPPTPERVAAFIEATGRAATEELGSVPPTWSIATVESVAVNAVMAGLAPGLAPVLLAVVEAALTPEFNLYGIQATTNPVAPLVVVSGPSRDRLGIAYGAGCLGPGYAANATLGRALRLVMLNLGGATPGVLDRATQGSPNKFAAVTGEHQERCPWESFHEVRRQRPDHDAVTLFGVTSLVNCLDHTSTTAEHLLMTMTATLASVGSNTTMLGGPVLLLLSPEHATILHRGGVDRADLAAALYEGATMPSALIPPMSLAELRFKRGAWPEAVASDTIRALDSPDALHVVVAGGDGPHSFIATSFGETAVVTRAVTWP